MYNVFEILYQQNFNASIRRLYTVKKAAAVMLAVTAAFICITVGYVIGSNNVNHYAFPENTFTAPIAASTQQQELGEYDINTATPEQLQNLPNIGPVLAQRIIDYRNEHGPFASIEDICKVSGIGQKRFENLKDYITVGG